MSTNPQFQDRTLTCVDCGQPFTWTAGDQAFFQKQGFRDEPKRCKTCRQLKKQRRADEDKKKGGTR